MCVERVQRIMMAIMLGIILALFGLGYFKIAVILQTFMIAMLLVWAAANFCPSTWVLKKLLPPCKWEK